MKKNESYCRCCIAVATIGLGFLGCFGTAWAQTGGAETAEQRMAALEAQALRQLGGGERANAIQTFRQLLSLDPGHELQSEEITPTARGLFTRLRQRFVSEQNVELTLRLPPQLPERGAVTVQVILDGPTAGVNEVIAFHRRPGQAGATFQPVSMSLSGELYVAQLPVPPAGEALELYFEVRAPSAHVLARSGSAGSPLRLGPEGSTVPAPAPGTTADETSLETDQDLLPAEPPEEPSRPRRRWYRTWWFWTIVGAVVAGGATTAIVLTVPDDEPGGGTLGTMTLP